MAKSASSQKKVAFVLVAPDAKSVAVAGDFTGWEQAPKPLKKNKSGEWKATVPLAPGRYEYRFMVDGQWLNDPQCTEHAPNPFGDMNCVRVVA